MIAENREHIENWESECTQAIQSALRQEYDSKSIKTPAIEEAAVKRMYMKAIDWGFAHNIEVSPQKAQEISSNAVQQYKNNWSNKKQGEDDRGHRLGKTSYL